VTIRIKRNDELNGKRLYKLLIDFLIHNKIAGSMYGQVSTDLENEDVHN